MRRVPTGASECETHQEPEYNSNPGVKEKVDFYAAETLIRNVLEALIMMAVMTALNVNDLGEFEKMSDREDWNSLVQLCAPVKIAHIRKSKKKADRDFVCCLFLQQALMYRDFAEAIQDGDSGRIANLLFIFTILFPGSNSSKYAIEMLEFVSGMT
ncbi:hypothetical protein RUND412_011061 [Rhizina undulata]